MKNYNLSPKNVEKGGEELDQGYKKWGVNDRGVKGWALESKGGVQLCILKW